MHVCEKPFYVKNKVKHFFIYQGRGYGKRLNIVIVSEGATDSHGNPITSQKVKDVITSNLKLDTRVTVLGQ